MFINISEICSKYKMKDNIKGVIHVGAHHGEEVPVYIENGIDNIVLFEPLEENFDIILQNVQQCNANIKGYKVALGNENRMIEMYLSSNSLESSSILKPKKHLDLYPDITFNSKEMVEMKRLDYYNFTDYNFLNMDVQGYELEVLRGSMNTLNYIDYVYCEVNRGEVYENNAYIEEVDKFLSNYHFNRVETTWWLDHDWGDAFYIKEDNNGRD